MSDVEKFYNAVAARFGVQKKFSELTPMEINILCQGVSMILGVIETFEDFHSILVDCECGRGFMNLGWTTIYNEGFGEFSWDKIVKEKST